MVVAQAAILAAVGLALGLIDMSRRGEKVRLSVTPATSVGPISPAGGQPPAGDGAGSSAPAPGAGSEPADAAQPPKAAAPESAAPQVAEQPAPSKAFTPSTEADLADRPGHITIERAQSLLAGGAIFIDARSADEYAAGHIDGAYHGSLSVFRSGQPPEILMLIPKEHPVVVYCGGGDDCSASEDVMLLLVNEGFLNVSVLHDGYTGWSALGLPIATGGGQ